MLPALAACSALRFAAAAFQSFFSDVSSCSGLYSESNKVAALHLRTEAAIEAGRADESQAVHSVLAGPLKKALKRGHPQEEHTSTYCFPRPWELLPSPVLEVKGLHPHISFFSRLFCDGDAQPLLDFVVRQMPLFPQYKAIEI
jgi:hypothetical protein